MIAARQAYRDHLVARMALDSRLACLDSDTGLFTGVDFGADAARYLNLGIAEHTLIGVAAGMAAAGWTPFVTTMAAFAASRALEAVKIDVAYNALPVRIAATHAGVAAGSLGPTHHELADLAVMRALPNMTVVVPGDAAAVPVLLDQLRAVPGPVYLRLGRGPTPPLPASAPAPELGRLQPLRGGRRAVLVATGPLPVLAALRAAELLAAARVDAGVLQAHTLKPFDTATLLEWTADAELVVAVEEHWRTGGLGSAVAETLAENAPAPLLRVGWPDAFVAEVGGQEHLLDRAGVSGAAIAAAVSARLDGTEL
ncbi:transketolase family protein [Allonocardiopsis opalescens]|uniref:Transketolase n=1 Tax=Allonocardiopsis opalescens TaxID=1144618 RepID=A0A2T0PYB1_9ACTN|nr:transketolase C-terminal domain-containing protein [Allonocardiopsis opalescens]PRX96508.1 transketolase [Allonocardiopsis opalescens]